MKRISIKEAIYVYGIGQTKLRELAKEAGALKKYSNVLYLDCEIFETYLEQFKCG